MLVRGGSNDFAWHKAYLFGLCSLLTCLTVLASGAKAQSRQPKVQDPKVTALFRAIRDNDLKTVEQLLTRNDLANSPDSDGIAPLMYAAHLGYADVCNQLLKSGADVNAKAKDLPFTPLVMACGSNSVEIVESFAKNGADIKQVSKFPFADGRWGSPLIAAIRGQDINRRLETVKKLIKFGVDVNQTTTDGLSPLVESLLERQWCKGISQFLIANKADVNLADANGKLPLTAAIYPYRDDDPSLLHHVLIRDLLKAGARIHLNPKGGESAFEMASRIKPSLIALLKSSAVDGD